VYPAFRHAGAPPARIAVAERCGPGRCARRHAVAAVTQNDADGGIGREGGQAGLEPAVGQRYGEEQVTRAVLAVFAHVEQGDLGAVGEPGFQRGGVDFGGHS
jgi:hypothetical protein